jgi:protoporphyrin/coproporphyrin ferrochelatase
MNEMPQRFAAARSPLMAPADHPALNCGRIGVLLLNLGTPDATSYWPMRRYLKEFLSDRRVIELNPVLWWTILNFIVLSKRPFTSGRAYRSIWNTKSNESPLRTITRGQSDQIAAILTRDPRIEVDWAMRYGTPSVRSRLEALRSKGCDRILLFPLYPQYSAATTATACDKAFDVLKTMRWQPAIRVVPPYFDDPSYIDALAASTRVNLAALDFEPEVVIASFHGLPKAYFEKGDPYHCHCAKTVRLLREALGWPKEQLLLTFQSRFGSAEWLQPYTADTIANLAKAGAKRIAVITPGFSSDCIETLEEMGIQGAETFHEHGGEKFAALPCLNDTPESISALTAILKRELSGWAEF